MKSVRLRWLRSVGWVVAFGLASALSLQGRLDIPGKGVISDAEKTDAVRIDRTGEVHVLDTLPPPPASSKKKNPKQVMSVAPDVGRLFLGAESTITEVPLVNGYKRGTIDLPSSYGSIKAMEVHPGGDRLIVVTEKGGDYTHPDPAWAGRGITLPPSASKANLDAGRVSVFSINIADPIGVRRNRSVLQSVTLKGVAFNVSDIAISPDGSFAIITVAGSVLSRATAFGVMTDPDELTGGVFKVDLNTMKQVAYIDTVMSGENSGDMRNSVVMLGGRIKHPTVTLAEQKLMMAEDKFAMSMMTSSMMAAFMGPSATAELMVAHENYMLMTDIYQHFGYLAAYAYSYPFDMIMPTGVGISNRGDFAMVTMERTNNIGVIPLRSYTSTGGDVSVFSDEFAFESAMSKTVNGENIDWSLYGTDAGAASAFSFWGPSDVAFYPDDSVGIVGAYGGSWFTNRQGFRIVGKIDLKNNRDIVFGTQPNRRWVARRTVDMTYPKHGAGRPAWDSDGDGLSNHVEAFNSSTTARNISFGDASKLASGAQTDINIPARSRVVDGQGALTHYLLPHSGVGYRFHYIANDPMTINAGNAAAISGIERIGKAWHASNPPRPYFIVQSIAHPGGGTMFNRVGEVMDYSERMGFDVNISYFKAGSDTCYHFN